MTDPNPFSAGFTDVAEDRYGEALRVRIYIRKHDGDLILLGEADILSNPTATPDESVEVTVLSVSSVTQKFQRKFGVVQGQTWQIRLSNIDSDFNMANPDSFRYGDELIDAWACIEAGFIDEDEWHVFGQGKIQKVVAATDLTVTLEMHDPIMDAIKAKLKTEVWFDTEAHGSNIYPSDVDEDSDYYENDHDGDGVDDGVTVLNATGGHHYDGKYTIEFTSSTAFTVTGPNGETDNGTTGTDCTVYDNWSNALFLIDKDGWIGGTFHTSDVFIFYSSKLRVLADLTPAEIIGDLLKDFADLTAYNVLDGSVQSVLYDTSTWGSVSSAEHALDIHIFGNWKVGTRVIDMIQDALKIVHGTIYPSETGQIAIWALTETGGAQQTLYGDHDRTDASLLRVERSEDRDHLVTWVKYKYLTIKDGLDAEVEVESSGSPFDERGATVSVGWRVGSAVVENSANQYLVRFGAARKNYKITSTLPGLLIRRAGDVIGIVEPFLHEDGQIIQMHSLTKDLVGNKCEGEGDFDEAVFAEYAIVGTHYTGGSEVIF